MSTGEAPRPEPKAPFVTVGILSVVGIGLLVGAYLFATANPSVNPSVELIQQARLWIAGGMLVVGLLLPFFALLLLRSFEHSNPTIRRMIYGYNAILSTLVLAAVLVVLNVLVATYLPLAFDWTSSQAYELSDDSRRVIRRLNQDLNVYVLYPRYEHLASQIENLLLKIQSENPGRIRFEFNYPSPNDPRELAKRSELTQRYGLPAQDETAEDGIVRGVLIVEDEGDDATELAVARKHEFIANAAIARRVGASLAFDGERQIVSAIRTLADDNKERIVYITQGSGEPLYRPNNPNRSGKPEMSLAHLTAMLTEARYTVRELHLVPSVDKAIPEVPEDAFAVITIEPVNISKPTVDALREYLLREGGHLLLLAGPDRLGDRWQMAENPDLEKLLEEYGVRLNHHVMYSYSEQPLPLAIGSIPNVPEEMQRAYTGKVPAIPLFMARSLTIVPESEKRFHVMPLVEMIRDKQIPQWAEENPTELLNSLRNPKTRKAIVDDRVVQTKVSTMAVTVRTKNDQAPTNPREVKDLHEIGNPKMVVFGSSVMATAQVNPQFGPIYDRLILSSVSWFKGRPELLQTVQPKSREQYRLSIGPEGLDNLIFYSLFGSLVFVTALGFGVLSARARG